MAITKLQDEIRLESAGATGHALQCLIREAAKTRHESRVSEAMQSLMSIASAQLGLDPEEHEFLWDQRGMLLAAAIALLDEIGVGGRGNVEGRSTRRYPGLERLGKGRKQATDGAAWTAAIARAGNILLSRAGVVDGVSWQLHPTPEGEIEVSGAGQSVSLSQAAHEWQYALAREGLRRVVGADPWFPYLDITFWGTVAEWSATVNRLDPEGTDATRATV